MDNNVRRGQITTEQAAGLMNHMRTEHSEPEEVGRVANAAGVKMLVISHLVIGGDPKAEALIMDGVRKHYSGGRWSSAHDLQEF